MKKLGFSYNWNNKLDCSAFTTIRLSGRFDIGDTVEVTETVKKQKVSRGLANCLGKKRFKLDDLNEFMAQLDTGYDVQECKNIIKRMYKNVDWTKAYLYFYLFKYK